MEENEYKQVDKNWKPGHVYVVDYGDGVTFKIGYTTVSPQIRLNQISKGSVIMPMHLVMSVDTPTNAYFLESLLHMHFDSEHMRGEWFTLEFGDLVALYQIMYFFGEVALYDRWYDLVPSDYKKYLDHSVFDAPLPYFERDGFEKEMEYWSKTDWGKMVLDNDGTE